MYGFLVAQLRSAPRPHFSTRQVQNSHPISLSYMLSQGSTTAQLDIVWMCSNGKDIYSGQLRHNVIRNAMSLLNSCELLDVFAQWRGSHQVGRRPLPFFIHSEFAKIPAHVGVAVAILILLRQPLIYWMHVLPFDRHFFHHLERDTVVLAAK